MSGKIPPLHIRRVLGACVVLAAVLLWPLPASAGAAWDAGALVGYLATVFAAVLYLYPLRGLSLRGESLPHRRLLTVSQHRRFGWVALGLAVLHTLMVLAVQPLTIHYFLPAAPLYMLCGIGALAALATLVPTGLATRTSLREACGRGRSGIGIAHAAVAALLPALLGAHLLGSGQLVDTRSKTIVLCLLLALPLWWSLLRPRTGGLRAGHWVALAASFAAAAVLLLLPIQPTVARLMEPALRPAEALPVHFPHELHMSVNCVVCHHNFRDDTGTANCIDCHRSSRTDLVRSSEPTFHLFCRQCHHDLALEGRKHGPIRACQPCHH